MSKLSIYETKWTDLVFENKNKEYGAYQLRQENTKTSITALFMALLLTATIGSLTMLISKLRTHDVIEPTPLDIPFTPIDLSPDVIIPTQPETVAPPQQQQAAAPITEAAPLTNPVVAPTEQVTQDIIPNAQSTPVTDNTSTGNGTAVNALPTTGTGNGTGTNITDNGNGNTVVNSAILDKMPEFPGGIGKFYAYVGNNFNKPELEAEKTLRVYVSFVIEKDGSMTDIVVKNDPGYGMGKEAIRVLKSLKTKWAPGILDGKPVRTAYNLPITIKTEIE